MIYFENRLYVPGSSSVFHRSVAWHKYSSLAECHLIVLSMSVVVDKKYSIRLFMSIISHE